MTQLSEEMIGRLMTKFDLGIVWSITDRGDSRCALLGYGGKYYVFRNQDHEARWEKFPRLTAKITVWDRTAAVSVTDTDPQTGAVSCVFYKTIGRPRDEWHRITSLRAFAEGEMKRHADLLLAR